MPTRDRPRLISRSEFSLVWVLTVVTGWILLVVAVLEVSQSSLRPGGAPLIMTATLLVLLELLPLVQGRGHDPQGVVMSTAFVCAMLFLWGPWPAILVVTIAALASDVNVGKPWWKVLFNPAQYNVSVAAGALVMLATGAHASLNHPLDAFVPMDILWMAGVWLAYFLTNNVLVSGVLAYSSSFAEEFFDDFWHYSAMTFAVLALSPLVVVLAQTSWLLLPLLLVPLLLVYRTAQLSLEQEHHATHDVLTNLSNRKNLMDSLQALLVRSRRDGEPFGLLLLDLDHFKEVNDTLGHQIGDKVLCHFAERLSASVREDDLVARLGGDEFAVIIPNAELPEIRALAERIRSELVDPVPVEDMMFDIDVSIGIALFPDHAERAHDLMRLADVAMYDAKESRSGIACYAANRDRNSPDRLTLLGELRQALADGTLELHYQPKVSIPDRVLVGVEAMIRWHHPVRGLQLPDDFVPLAERSGIMPQITERVVALALHQLTQWRAMGLDIPVAVNVSVSDLAGGRLINLVRSVLADRDLPPGLLQLEITERVIAQEPADLNAVLNSLAELGVTLSLDDFGTGYSSLLRLQSLPVDEIKIDRAFVCRLSDTGDGPAIVRAVVDLAHGLGVPAIAEGVETEQEFQILGALGCDGAQGWYIAAPMAAAEATAWILEQRRPTYPQPA